MVDKSSRTKSSLDPAVVKGEAAAGATAPAQTTVPRARGQYLSWVIMEKDGDPVLTLAKSTDIPQGRTAYDFSSHLSLVNDLFITSSGSVQVNGTRLNDPQCGIMNFGDGRKDYGTAHNLPTFTSITIWLQEANGDSVRIPLRNQDAANLLTAMYSRNEAAIEAILGSRTIRKVTLETPVTAGMLGILNAFPPDKLAQRTAAASSTRDGSPPYIG